MNTFQSVWAPVSSAAAEIKDLSIFLFVMGAVVFVVVLLTLILALRKRRGSAPSDFKPGTKFVLWTGLIIPTLILLIMLLYSIKSTLVIRDMHAQVNEDALIIEVTGHQWWWEVRYPKQGIVTANEIHLPAGTPVRLELMSKDVVHSIWVPNVHGKMDLLPEYKTKLNVIVDQPGTYRGQCAEYCGTQHAWMGLYFVVLPIEDFARWSDEKQKANPARVQSLHPKGKELFFSASCHTCHAIKGTSAMGQTGPDLSHLSSRLSLGAGTIKNDRKNLKAWIQDSHQFKPSNRMPEYDLSPEDLDQLVDYLLELK